MSKRQRKRVARGLAVCFIVTLSLTGIYTWNNYKERNKDEIPVEKSVADAEEKEEVTNYETEETSGIAEKAEEKVVKEEQIAKEDENVKAKVSSPKQSSFSENDHLLWPVDGNVKMSYSMDRTIYFESLDQYKYNPAMIISGAENDNVISAAPGVVKSIDILPQTGTTVTIDMGNGYECLYGQLKEVPVKTGDYVAAGTVIGYLNEPTKYYSLEGCNLYFEMRKDGQPVNPTNYMIQE